MSMHSFFSRFCHSPIPRRATVIVALIALAWSGSAICGEIHDAAKIGDITRVKALLQGDPNLAFSKDSLLGLTPLHVAALTGHKDVAELLLASKADVNTRDLAGQTPLHWAADRGSKDVVELLLANKADINARRNDGETPLHFAVRAGHKDVAALLLAGRADVNAKDKGGWTPLHFASDGGDNKGRVGIAAFQQGRCQYQGQRWLNAFVLCGV